MSDMKRVAPGDHYRDKKNAVFLVIYVKEISPWKYFNDDIKGMRCPRKVLINSPTKLLDLPNSRALDNINHPEEYD